MKKQIDKINIYRLVLAVFISVIAIFLIIFCVSKNPSQALKSFYLGPFSSLRRIGNIIEVSIPLMFSSLATVFLFRTGLFNLSAEGAFFIGTVVATVIAQVFNSWGIFALVLAILGAMVVAAGVTTLPGALKVKINANIIVTSLMMNFVCLNLGLFVIHSFFLDNSLNTPYSHKFGESFKLLNILPGTRVHIGLVVAIAVIIMATLLLNHTAFGLRCKIIGSNSKFARYAGLSSDKIILQTQLIGGAIAGLGGAIELFGMYNRFQYGGLTNHGWEGIPIAIIASHNPKYLPLATLFFAYLKIGADIMARESDVPFEIVQVIQAIMIVIISAQALLKGARKRRLLRQINQGENQNA